MSLLKIVTWPNPILDLPADPVTDFNGDLKRLVDNMFETMYSAPGVGLAAVQVGVPKRLFVMDCSGGKDPAQRVVMINPEVVSVEGKQNGEEGCLSFPGMFIGVERNLRAIVRAHDPAVKNLPAELAGKFELAGSALSAVNDAVALVVATEWPEYANVGAASVVAAMREATVVDPNRFLVKTLGAEQGVRYVTVGQGSH